MGNHFRTSGAGDDAPKTQAGVQGSRFATPDSEGQPVAQAPAQPADQAQPASDPFAYNPTSDVALSGTAGFEPVQAVTARVEQPQAGAATPQPTMAGIPDPLAPATPAPQPAQSGLFAAIPDPMQPAAPVVESDQAAEVASLDNALNNPDFTSVFAPIDPQASRKKMAKQAGVEPVDVYKRQMHDTVYRCVQEFCTKDSHDGERDLEGLRKWVVELTGHIDTPKFPDEDYEALAADVLAYVEKCYNMKACLLYTSRGRLRYRCDGTGSLPRLLAPSANALFS